MNIKNFIASIFSSGFKRNQKQQQTENNNQANKSSSMNQEEDLLANLRKSKLFMDDSEIGMQKKLSTQNSMKEDVNSQALLDAEKIVGLMHQSSRKSSIRQGLDYENKKSNSGIAKYVSEVKQELSAKKQQENNNTNAVLYKVNDFSIENAGGKQTSHLFQQQMFSDVNNNQNSINMGYNSEYNNNHNNYNNQQLNNSSFNLQQLNQNQLNHSIFANQQQHNQNLSNSSMSNNMQLNNQSMNQNSMIHQHTNGAMKNELQSNSFIRSNMRNSQSKVIDNSVLPSLNNNSRYFNEVNQKLNTQFTFNEDVLPVISGAYNQRVSQVNNQYYPQFSQNNQYNLRQSEVQQNFEQNQQQPQIQQNMQHNLFQSQLHHSTQSSQQQSSYSQLQSESQSELEQIQEVDLTNCQPKCLSQVDSQSSQNQNPHSQLQSVRRSSSTSSRIRGSSSKKKNIVSESPISTKGKRDFTFEKFPTLGQSRENIQLINRYQPQVKEDVEGENEGQAQPILDQNIVNMNKMMEEEVEKVQELNMNFVQRNIEQSLQSDQKQQFECLSTKAEPATNVKQRSNSFFFDLSCEKNKFFNHDEINSKKSNLSSQSLHNDTSEKRMSIESSYSKASSNKQNSNCMEPEIQAKTSGYEGNNQFDENGENSVNSFFNSKDSQDNKCLSEQKIKSNCSSPSRVNLSGFQKHKKIDMMIDKSEIPPPHQTRSAHKVPSPIKEVEEHSQRNHKFTPKKNEMEVMDKQKEVSEFDHVKEESNSGTGSPKMRQKSVKFDEDIFTLIQNPNNNSSSDEEIKHQRFQSRKPTPYNHEKQHPKSYLSRQNKFKSEDSSSESSCKEITDSSNSTQNGQMEEMPVAPINTESNNNKEEVEEVDQQQSSSFKEVDTKNENNEIDTAKEKSPQPTNKFLSQKKEINNSTQKKVNGLSIPRTPVHINNSQSKVVKQTLGLKSKEKNNIFLKGENNHSTPILASNSIASSSTTSSSAYASNVKNNFKLPLNKNNNSNSNGQNAQNNKRKPNLDEQALLCNFSSAQKIQTTSEALIPPQVRQATQMRGTMLNGTVPTQLKSVFKTCMYCQNEIKLKEEVKTFTCCHKAHLACLPKEKNQKCLRCNPSNQIKKF